MSEQAIVSCKEFGIQASGEELSENQEHEEDHVDSASSTSSLESENLDKSGDVTWELEDVRRHWTLMAHCDSLIFPNEYPNLKFASKMGRYLWHLQRASIKPSQMVIRDLSQCAGYTLRKITLLQQQVEQFVLCDCLLDLDWLDHASKSSFLENLGVFLSCQTRLSVASFENAHLKRNEGVQVLLALGNGSAKHLKRLYLWQYFARDENPVLLDTTYCKYRDKGAFKASSTCKISFWRSLVRFYHLTTLAINYGYLADLHGHTLCMLASVLTGRLRELQLLCLEEESPYPNRANEFDGKFKIPDSSWEDALQYCPRLLVQMVVIALPVYEHVTAFMSPSIPLSKLYMSTGIVLGNTTREWHTDCIMKTLCNWYSSTLEALSIHLWHNRELLDGILLKLLDDMPYLTTFEFCGVLYRKNTMENICQKIRDGYYLNIKRIRIRLQLLGTPPSHFDDSKNIQASLKNDMETIRHKYKAILKERDIKMDLGIYPI